MDYIYLRVLVMGWGLLILMNKQKARVQYWKAMNILEQAQIQKIDNNNKKMMNPPIDIAQQALQKKYSSSQSYFYSKLINSLCQQHRLPSVTNYQDIEYYIDEEQYLKRSYSHQEYRNKMFTFKEYYFYHKDCPRIFIQDVQLIYAKWQDRKRNFMYKKLKYLLDQGADSQGSSLSQDDVRGLTHFLHEMSEYNPFSKKYYLRVQAKKEKELLNKKKDKDGEEASNDEISSLKHQLSYMLKQMNELSMISTLDSTRIQSKSKIYHRKTLTQVEGASYQHSTTNNSNSIIKLNFRKKPTQIKSSLQAQKKSGQKQKISKDRLKRNSSKYKGIIQVQKLMNDIQHIAMDRDKGRDNSPKLNPVQNKQSSLEKLKSKSIFAFTSLGQLHGENKIRLNTKREALKINLQRVDKMRRASKDQVNVQKIDHMQKNDHMDKIERKGQITEKKKAISIKCNSYGKLKPNKLDAIEGLSRQVSVRKLKTRPDEFCDKKLAGVIKNTEAKLSSYKSQHINLKKPSFKIKQSDPTIHGSNKKKLQIKL